MHLPTTWTTACGGRVVTVSPTYASLSVAGWPGRSFTSQSAKLCEGGPPCGGCARARWNVFVPQASSALVRDENFHLARAARAICSSVAWVLSCTEQGIVDIDARSVMALARKTKSRRGCDLRLALLEPLEVPRHPHGPGRELEGHFAASGHRRGV